MADSIGAVGLGSMGGILAGHLVGWDRPLIVHDLSAAHVARFVERGAAAAASAGELAEQVGALVTCLPNGPDVETVYLGPGGILEGARPGLLCLELSTIDPEVTRTVAAAAAEKGVTVMDCAIGGNTAAAQAHRTVFMVGGSEADVERARPYLERLGERFVHCGPTGAGATMKLVNNLLSGAIFAVTCEGMLLGKKAGLTVEVMQDVMSTTGANSGALRQSVLAKAVPRDFEPGFRLALLHKDHGLASQMARRVGAPLTITNTIQELRTVALDRGLGDFDSSVFVKLFEELAGVELTRG